MSKEKTLKEMTLEEAKAFRASLYKEQPIILTEEQKKECFRVFWAKEKSKYGKKKELESILWAHMKSAGFTDPKMFEQGLKHFGLKVK